MLGFVVLMAIGLMIGLPFGCYYFYEAIQSKVLGRILGMGACVILNALLGLYCRLIIWAVMNISV